MDIRRVARLWASRRKRDNEAGKPKTINIHVHFPLRIATAESAIRHGTRFVEQHVFYSTKSIDPERMLDEFLALKHSDTELLAFLNKYGVWEDGQPFEVNEFWKQQEFVRMLLLLNHGSRGKLLSRSGFGKLPGPLHKSLSVDFEYNDGGLHFVVNTSSCLDAVIALAQIELANGSKRRKCARKDCPVVFSISTGDKRSDRRKYHDRKCGHLDVVRRSRLGKAKKKNEVTATGESCAPRSGLELTDRTMLTAADSRMWAGKCRFVRPRSA
jgi:hypothetical protein